MRTWLARFNRLLDQGLNKEVFDNLRNLLMCALLLAAGTEAVRTKTQLLLDVFSTLVAGWGLILLASVLMLLNMFDGLRKLARTRHHLGLQVLLCLIYVVVAVRVVEIVWNFRAA